MVIGWWRRGRERGRNTNRQIERRREVEQCAFTDITWTSGRRQILPNHALPSTFSKCPATHAASMVFILCHFKWFPNLFLFIQEGRQSYQRLREINEYRSKEQIRIYFHSGPLHPVCPSSGTECIQSRILTASTMQSTQSHGERRGESTGFRGPPDRHLAN